MVMNAQSLVHAGAARAANGAFRDRVAPRIRLFGPGAELPSAEPNRILLDVTLPGEDGARFCRELVAWIEHCVHGDIAPATSRLEFQDLEMDVARRKVTRGERPIRLTAKEFALLEYFMRRPERVLTRDNLRERVWGLNYVDASNVVEVYVSRLRRSLETGPADRLIHTVVGIGYVLSADGPPGKYARARWAEAAPPAEGNEPAEVCSA